MIRCQSAGWALARREKTPSPPELKKERAMTSSGQEHRDPLGPGREEGRVGGAVTGVDQGRDLPVLDGVVEIVQRGVELICRELKGQRAAGCPVQSFKKGLQTLIAARS